MWEASNGGETAELERLIANGGDVNAKDSRVSRISMCMVSHGCRTIYAAGAIPGENGPTPRRIEWKSRGSEHSY